MFRLVETIRSENGRLLNLNDHNERLNRSIRDLFGKTSAISIEDEVRIPEFAGSGILKCRVEYDMAIRKIEFIPYVARAIRSLRLIEDNTIDYSYKFNDREKIEELFSRRGDCDDILIIKNGMITDSSYANVIFRDQSGNWITPSSYLLAGTRRASLLRRGLITEATTCFKDIEKYTEVKLINAMLDIDDSEAIPVSKISR